MARQGVSAKTLANHGQYRDAAQPVRSAAALAMQADLLSERADILLELSPVLATVG